MIRVKTVGITGCILTDKSGLCLGGKFFISKLIVKKIHLIIYDNFFL